MPWGSADSKEQMFCIPCAVIGSSFRQRMKLTPGPMPTPRVRICEGCYERGWRLVGPGVEVGEFWLPRGGARVNPRQTEWSREIASEGKTA